MTWEEYKANNKDWKGTEENLRLNYKLEKELDAIPNPIIKFKPWGRTKFNKAIIQAGS